MRGLTGALIVAVAPMLMAQAAAPKPFSPGDIFIDRNGDTLQVTQCRGSGWAAECELRRLKASGDAPFDPSGRWWSVDVLRGSERQWTSNGGAPYRGPAVPLARTTTAAAPAPTRAVTPAPVVAPVAAAGNDCPRPNRSSAVPGSRPASPALFRQVLMQDAQMGTFGNRWYNGRIDRMSVGAPVKNVVRVDPGRGAMRLHDGAPPNVTMHPVHVRIGVCEGSPGGSSGYRMRDSKYMCFVGRDATWTCGAY